MNNGTFRAMAGPLRSTVPSTTIGNQYCERHCTKCEERLIRFPCTCSELAREKMWSRLHIAPLLQAEEDRDQVRRYYADKAREKELLGAEAKVYNSDRYVLPRDTT